MTEEHAAQRLAERIGRLEEEVRQVKKVIVQKYGKPWWKVCSENPDFEQFYANMVSEARLDLGGAASRSHHPAVTLEHNQRTKDSDRPGRANTADLEPTPMSSDVKDLEKRIALIENTLQEMKALLTKKEKEPWWERTAGMFKDDEVFDEIVEEMRKA